MPEKKRQPRDPNRPHGNFGRKHSPERKAAISRGVKARYERLRELVRVVDAIDTPGGTK